jgi:F-type H+-transporting ATPase subunit b
MEQIIQQVGKLLLGSIPTLILFILLVLAYQFLVQGPLTAILKTRRARTSGAVEHADKAIAAAEAKAEEYATRLRHARSEIFGLREQRMQQWNAERDTALQQAREKAEVRVLEAKVGLERDSVDARSMLMGQADQLAEEVVRAVMPATAGGSR